MLHLGSLVAACGIYFPNQGSNPGPLHWEHRVLATGPPGKSQFLDFFNIDDLPVHCSHILDCHVTPRTVLLGNLSLPNPLSDLGLHFFQLYTLSPNPESPQAFTSVFSLPLCLLLATLPSPPNLGPRGDALDHSHLSLHLSLPQPPSSTSPGPKPPSVPLA